MPFLCSDGMNFLWHGINFFYIARTISFVLSFVQELNTCSFQAIQFPLLTRYNDFSFGKTFVHLLKTTY